MRRRAAWVSGVVSGVLLAVFLGAGCGQSAGSASSVSGEAAPPGSAAGAGGAKLRALLRCLSAPQKAQAAPLAESGRPFREITEACADLYTEPACREALLATARDSAPLRLPSTVRACREAYCPHLAAPKPELCASPPGDDASAWLPELRPFWRRLLAYELDVPESDLPASVDATFLLYAPLPVAPPAATPATELTATFELGLDRQGKSILSFDDEGKRRSFPLPAAPTTIDFNAAIQAASAKGTPARAILRADQRISHGTVIAMLDALKQHGITKIAFSVQPAPP